MLDRLGLRRRQPGKESRPKGAEPERSRRRAILLLSSGLLLLIVAYAVVILYSRPASPGDGLRYDD